MLKKTGYGLACLAMVCALAATANINAAKNDDEIYAVPQAEGTYDVPGRPDLKLKVTVYHGKQDEVEKFARGDKSQPQAPVLSCMETAIADPDSESQVKLAGWKLPANWTYAVNTSSVPSSIGAGRAGELIGNAYAAWQTVLGSQVTFTRGANTRKVSAHMDGQNIVAWGTAENTALAVTYTWYYTDTGYAAEIDTVMNSKFAWSWSDPKSWGENQTCAYTGVYDAQDILTHELGHTVGLGDEYESPFVNNTMYGYGSTGETKKDTLTSGDISAATAIYAAL